MRAMCVTPSRAEEKASERVAVGKAAKSFEAEVEDHTLMRTVGPVGRGVVFGYALSNMAIAAGD